MGLAVSHLVQLDAPSVLEKVLAGQFRARTDAITEIVVFKWTFSKKSFALCHRVVPLCKTLPLECRHEAVLWFPIIECAVRTRKQIS
jgi:hypothetical protein